MGNVHESRSPPALPVCILGVICLKCRLVFVFVTLFVIIWCNSVRRSRDDSRPIYSNPKGGRRLVTRTRSRYSSSTNTTSSQTRSHLTRLAHATLSLCYSVLWIRTTNDAMFRTCCLILCLVAGSRQLSISEFVVPSSIEVGQDAELRCRYDLSPEESEKGLFVKWWWTPATGEDRKQLYQRIVGHPAESTQHKLDVEIKENDTIVLLQLQPNATGTYECEVSIIDEIRKHQELIVYSQGSGPQLNISLEADGPDEDEEEDVRIECQAADVAPAPDLVVSVSGKEINMTETLDGPDEDGFYTVISNATLSKSDVVGVEIRCELLYLNPNVTHAKFITTELYDPTGALTSTEMPEETTEMDATLDSLQHSPGSSYQVRSSWALLLAIPVLTQIFGPLRTSSF